MNLKRLSALTAGALMLAGCAASNMGSLFSDSAPATPPAQPAAPAEQAQPAPAGMAAKVALLLPLTAPGETAQIATAMKQAAELAVIDAGGQAVTLTTKDTAGTAAGAQAAAQAALDEGAEIILGPLLGAEVQAVAPLAKARNVPVIAFSSVSSVAGNGVYLMSFLPEEEINNIARYAVANNMTPLAALVPKSQYGAVVERALVEAGQGKGIAIAGVERFPRTTQALVDPATNIMKLINDPSKNVKALMIAEGGDLLSTLGAALKNAGYKQGSLRILGTGLWDNPATSAMPIAQGGLYAGVAPDLVKRFEDRYSSQYGGKPSRIASLAYDAVGLSVTLARNPQGQRYTAQTLTNPDGFQGMNGLFRFRQNGLIERGLSILQVTPSGPQVIAPAPARFAAAS